MTRKGTFSKIEFAMLREILSLDDVTEWVQESLEDGTLNMEKFKAFNSVLKAFGLEKIEPYTDDKYGYE